MKRILSVFVTVAFAATFVCDGALGFDAYDESANEPNPLTMAAEELVAAGMEGLGALGIGAFVGLGTFCRSSTLAWLLMGASTDKDSFGPMLWTGLAAGYGLGVPLGSAVGASSAGCLAGQGGSFWWSWAGAELGAVFAAAIAWGCRGVAGGSLVTPIRVAGPIAGAVLAYNLTQWTKETQAGRGSFWWSGIGAGLGAVSGAGFAWAICEVTDWPGARVLAVPALALGPTAGAVIGYNMSRPKGTQTSEEWFCDSSARHGPALSFLVPEVELRGERLSSSIREPMKGSPTLTYKLTLARLNF